jgi:hypothetical protein
MRQGSYTENLTLPLEPQENGLRQRCSYVKGGCSYVKGGSFLSVT